MKEAMESMRLNYFRAVVGRSIFCNGCGKVLDYRTSGHLTVNAAWEDEDGKACESAFAQVLCFKCLGLDDAGKIAGAVLARLTASQPGVAIKVEAETAAGSATVEGSGKAVTS